ncbi:hypothetical protein BB737_09790 [Mycobacterium avium subsp. hominissuis]|uniref:Uncharacterized protein n=1 Tax=Mycobacterium avium subsp. hominissuis TaxID=439334 RepID=A0A2A3LCF1_MYCAV|nr:hypothetical protein [Mycobacterium avium]ATO67771.1 hypothetical protein BJP78_13510 [Mycobacterium avium subsp. hominissuis]PBJ38399.1 hypothetical protein XV03_04880 [Mycobacterium avium subsp. hominissuis]PBJ43106.1 hypothetical protein BI294_02010 [Mycobacterium avium subsp. hominissuis]PBJ66020.1 hypothetical protein BB737_09790 [Mycobacterium avium subsp. hominissuis]QXD08173.1 hypothetical protein BB735_011890 [Mycobacterium avium subsp. hominissuis]
MSLPHWISTWVGAALLTAGLVEGLVPFSTRNHTVEHVLAVCLAIVGGVLLIVVLSRRNPALRGQVLLSVVLLSAAASLSLYPVLYDYDVFFQVDVYICALLSVLGLLFVLLPLRGRRPATKTIAKGFVAVGAVVVVAAVVEALIPLDTLYGPGCPHLLISTLFTHACSDWFAMPALHYLFLDLVIPVVIGVVLLSVGVLTLRSADGEATQQAADAAE